VAYHSFDGLNAYFTVSGEGPDVVLLHAGGSSGKQWRKAAACLEDAYRLIAPDFMGFGESDNWPGSSGPSHDDQARLVASLVAQECRKPVHVVGHSFGGAVAVRFALANPEALRRLVLIEPVLTPLLNLAGRQDVFAEYERLARGFIENSRADREEVAWCNFIDYRNGAGSWAGLSETARTRFRAGTKQTADTFESNLVDPTSLEDCRIVASPTLVLCGENTTEPDRVVTEILQRELPDSAYQILAGAEHMSPLTHPEAVAAAIRSHLETVEGNV
jgi:pimeloyl-ACP methyl ester carboxylesterase